MKHCHIRHYLLFCTVYVCFHTSMTKGSGILILSPAQKKHRLTSVVKSFTFFLSLHISSIVPKTREKWFPIVRGKYKKTEHSKVKCFLHIPREAEIHTILKTQNMGIVNLFSTGKLWVNTNIPKVWLSYIFRTPLFRVKEKPTQFQKHGETEFS